MSALRPARDDEVARLWPAVKSARLFTSAGEFSAYRGEGPWRVRVSDDGEAMVLGAWRDGGDVLWIRGMWASSHRVPTLVDHVCTVARGQGFARVLSPLLAEDVFAPYGDAGMAVRETLVVVQARLVTLSIQPSPRVEVRPLGRGDVPWVEFVDQACFDPFWRYGRSEIVSVSLKERLTIAELEGRVVGYSTVSMHGSTATLGRIAVIPEARSKGVGQALIAEQVARAERAGVETLTLCTQESNSVARAFYERCGMAELPRRHVIGEREA